MSRLSTSLISTSDLVSSVSCAHSMCFHWPWRPWTVHVPLPWKHWTACLWHQEIAAKFPFNWWRCSGIHIMWQFQWELHRSQMWCLWRPFEDFTDGCDTQSPCTYSQWQPDELRTEKMPHQSSLNDAIEMLKKQLQPFSRHVYDMKRQHFELRHLKNTLPRGSIILQVDFAESYALKHQREIMSAHWANSSVTIYTGMVYVRDAPEEPLRIGPLP